MLDYGYYLFEKVFYIDGQTGQVRWKKFAARHPMDVYEWNWDNETGELVSVTFNTPSEMAAYTIPASKLLIFTFDEEAGDPRGMSILRSAYKHWYFKEQLYKIDAIQKERHGIGVPVIVLPPNFTAADKSLAEELGRNLRANEKAHVVLPPMWQIMMLKLEGHMVNALESADHHDKMLFRNILADFAAGDTQDSDMFLKSVAHVAEMIREVFNKQAIPELLRYNFGVDGSSTVESSYPELRVRRIGDSTDWRTLSFATRNLVGSGVLRPDEDLEEWFRAEMDLPRRDPTTTREVVPSGQFNRTGLPRQSSAANMRQAQRPASNRAGFDQSGENR